MAEQANPTHSFSFPLFAELMSRICLSQVGFKAAWIGDRWVDLVFKKRGWCRQVRLFSAPTRFKCLRFNFTIFLAAFYFCYCSFSVFFFLHNFQLALKVSVHVVKRPQRTSTFLHYIIKHAIPCEHLSQFITLIFLFYVFRQTLFWFSVFGRIHFFGWRLFLAKGSMN